MIKKNILPQSSIEDKLMLIALIQPFGSAIITVWNSILILKVNTIRNRSYHS
jgi:hypothetical protein